MTIFVKHIKSRRAEFIRRLNQQTGRRYRLPTEAEWEYAARAGTTTPFSYGESIIPRLVNYAGTVPYGNFAPGEFREVTIEVNDLYPNPWGLYHVHGNVWEWCADEWHSSYDSKPQQLRRNGSIAWTRSNTNLHPSINGMRVLRGGSWDFSARSARSAARFRFWAVNRNFNTGFRVVLDSGDE
ncbi:MAG: formylglycine-generating enzyme family protein [Prochlorotrichaceae cyanobacterium]